MEARKPTFINPEVLQNLTPKISALPDGSPMQRAMGLRKIIRESADELATHPLILVKELRLGETDSALKAREIEEKRVARYGYVGDIHGLSDADFAKLRETLVRENFDQIFFMGDIGGSEKLAKLQKLYYHGGSSDSFNQLTNKYKGFSEAEQADDATILRELKPGYLNLKAYEKVLAQEGLSEEDAKRQAGELTDEQILEGIRWTVKHVHYGHYASDLSDDIKKSLAKDVEGYYLRFAHMVAELRLHTKAKVYTVQGNWDARLPIDFRPNTQKAEPLPENERVFNVSKFFKDSGIEYFKGIGIIDDGQSLHILVPFDPLMSPIEAEKLAKLKHQIAAAREKGKTIMLVTHAVPAWQEKHNQKPKPNSEGDISEKGLRGLLGELDPDEVIYGHEHYIRKDAQGNLLLNKKYRVIKKDGQITIGEDEDIQSLDKKTGGVIATHIPVPGEPFNGIASVEIPRLAKDKSPRGRTGLREPVRVGGNAVPQRRISQELPTGIDVLHPQIDAKNYIRNPYATSPKEIPQAQKAKAIEKPNQVATREPIPAKPKIRIIDRAKRFLLRK